MRGAQRVREADGGGEFVGVDVGIGPVFNEAQPGDGIGAEGEPVGGLMMCEPEDDGCGGQEAGPVDDGVGGS